MNYQKIYDDICKRGQDRQLPKEVYTEKHHIVPKCLGGTNEKSNLTILTAREHFLVHYILTRIYPNNSKIWNACFRMCHSGKGQQRLVPNSKLYEFIKTEWISTKKGKTWEELFGIEKASNMKQECSQRMLNQIVTDQKREKCRLINLGRTRSDETKKMIGKYSSERQQGKGNVMFGKKHSEKSKRQMSLNSRKVRDENIDMTSIDCSHPSCIKIFDPESNQIFGSQKVAALYFNISANCVHNWIKRGWLIKLDENYI